MSLVNVRFFLDVYKAGLLLGVVMVVEVGVMDRVLVVVMESTDGAGKIFTDGRCAARIVNPRQ
jgi:hypothetical protein